MTWPSVPLGEVVQLNYGKPLPDSGRTEGGPVPVFGANGVKAYSERFLHQGPSIIIGRKGSAGEVNRAGGPFWPLDVTYFTTHDHRRLDFEFLDYALRQMDLPSLAKGVKPGINRNEVYALPLPLPPLDEQKRIVAVLDQAFDALDRARALTEANLADVSSLRGQYLDDQIAKLFAEFGSIKVNEIADVKGGKRLPKGQKTASEVTPYPYVSVRNMTEAGTVDMASVQYISKANHDAIKRYTISSSDVYVSIAGTIGKTGVVPAELDGANLTENAAKLVLRTGWDRDFVYWWTRSGSFSDQAIEQTRTAAQPKLALERLGAIELPNAELNSQKALVACMERLRGSFQNLTESYTGKLSELRDLRQSLLKKAFAGELT